MRGTRAKMLRKLSYAFGNSPAHRRQAYKVFKKMWPGSKQVLKMRFEKAKKLGYLEAKQCS